MLMTLLIPNVDDAIPNGDDTIPSVDNVDNYLEGRRTQRCVYNRV